MTDVIAKLRRIPTAGKIAIGVAVAVGLGAAAYLLLGPAAGGATAIGGLVSAWAALTGGDRTLGDTAADLAKRARERAESDAATSRRAAELAARDRAAIRLVEAKRAARAAGAGDDGDPNRVLDRHSDGPRSDADD